ncbi:MAG TPA: hypothetical protein VMB21_02375, partial [Candidatus Limnocylindria bacterium]|nr:hypothetical protein [Candidatus Limnocylindria bacterium]
MSSKTIALAFAFGLVVGVGATALVLTVRSGPPEVIAERNRLQAEVSTATNQVAELGEQLVTVSARTKRLEDDNLKLATRVQELMKQTAGAGSAKSGQHKPGNPLAAMFGGEDSES